MSKKHILILGGSHDQLFMLNTAKNMNLGTVVLDGNKSAPGLKQADYAKNINFKKLDEVYIYLDSLISKNINVCGVSTMGCDVPDILAKISKKYEWCGPSIETGKLAANKYLMKLRFEEEGIPVPKFAKVRNEKDIEDYWGFWGCEKIIIKPTDRAGSRGVKIIEHKKDLSNFYEFALNNSIIKEVMIEEFIEGPQISTESIIYDEMFFTPGFADREYDYMESFHPQIMENGGWVPSSHSSYDIKKVEKLVERASRSLGIQRGVAKGDVVINHKKGPMIIEIAARLSGGDFCESLVPLSNGVNYVQNVLQIAIGDKPNFENLTPRNPIKFIANRYFFLPQGVLEEIEGFSEVKSLDRIEKFEIFYEIGDKIPKIESHGQRVGVFVIKADSKDEAISLIDFVYRKVNFKINGSWYDGSPSSFNK